MQIEILQSQFFLRLYLTKSQKSLCYFNNRKKRVRFVIIRKTYVDKQMSFILIIV